MWVTRRGAAPTFMCGGAVRALGVAGAAMRTHQAPPGDTARDERWAKCVARGWRRARVSRRVGCTAHTYGVASAIAWACTAVAGRSAPLCVASGIRSDVAPALGTRHSGLLCTCVHVLHATRRAAVSRVWQAPHAATAGPVLCSLCAARSAPHVVPRARGALGTRWGGQCTCRALRALSYGRRRLARGVLPRGAIVMHGSCQDVNLSARSSPRPCGLRAAAPRPHSCVEARCARLELRALPCGPIRRRQVIRRVTRGGQNVWRAVGAAPVSRAVWDARRTRTALQALSRGRARLSPVGRLRIHAWCRARVEVPRRCGSPGTCGPRSCHSVARLASW